MDENTIEDIIKRLTRLEEAIFSNEHKTIKKSSNKRFIGPTGGTRLLIQRGFFNKKKGLSETRDELTKEGYHYSLQAVQMTLRRFSRSGGPLVALKEGGKKVYAKRK